MACRAAVRVVASGLPMKEAMRGRACEIGWTLTPWRAYSWPSSSMHSLRTRAFLLSRPCSRMVEKTLLNG